MRRAHWPAHSAAGWRWRPTPSGSSVRSRGRALSIRSACTVSCPSPQRTTSRSPSRTRIVSLPPRPHMRSRPAPPVSESGPFEPVMKSLPSWPAIRPPLMPCAPTSSRSSPGPPSCRPVPSMRSLPGPPSARSPPCTMSSPPSASIRVGPLDSPIRSGPSCSAHVDHVRAVGRDRPARPRHRVVGPGVDVGSRGAGVRGGAADFVARRRVRVVRRTPRTTGCRRPGCTWCPYRQRGRRGPPHRPASRRRRSREACRCPGRRGARCSCAPPR